MHEKYKNIFFKILYYYIKKYKINIKYQIVYITSIMNVLKINV